MADTTREHSLEALIVDLTDGGLRRWQDIQKETGLSDERCKEIELEISEVFKRYEKRNRLS